MANLRARKGAAGAPQGKRPAAEAEAPEPPDAVLSTPLWLLKHTQGIVTAATTVGVLWLRNTHAVYYVAGALGTGWTAKLLKKVIKEPRPEGSSITKTHGMPSTHSSTMTFMCLYLCLAMPSSLALLVPFVAAAPPVVMWSRVRLGLHTPAQCLVGATLGVTCALVATAVWSGLGPHAGLAQTLAPRGDDLLRQLEASVREHVGV